MKKVRMFGGKEELPVDPGVVSTSVPRVLDRSKGRYKELTPDAKMLCALRKALASQSGLDASNGARYYIDGSEMYVTKRGGGNRTKPGELATYTAAGRFKLGIAFPKHVAYKVCQFSITFRDTVDERGLPDVTVIDPTVIDALPKNTPLKPAQA